MNSRSRKKKEQIHDAAKQLFLHNGFSGTSMDMVRDKAGVSKQTLYVYYSSKEELLTDVINQLISVISQEEFSLIMNQLSLSNHEEVENSLRLVGQRILDHLMQEEYIGLARVIISEISRFPHLGQLFQEAVPKQVLSSIANLLEKANQMGSISVEDTAVAARGFVGPLVTYVLIDGLLVGDGPIRKPDEEEITKLVRFYMKALE
ncbi:TetR/AcrR family transcriptional regulator [Pseudalkalibacillus decolorationis]|uniref:TetR/AcrR family transcriptional regulator n=1 Tax=Pseudalkalibacillus decolorationis TaxID=163879 RepID=UPI0021479405|nr:TetR/AcrR family transcriptional regulator [Pseudalkalibacillus decolorationis]